MFQRFSLLLLLNVLVSVGVFGADPADGFEWSSLEPSTNLSWVDCYSGFKCSRLQVPLDYKNAENGKSAIIAVIKYPATVQGDGYSGSILINPGGPGGSGVDMALRNGKQLQSIVGSNFDIVGFDPRGMFRIRFNGHWIHRDSTGVFRSTPRVTIFQSDEERILWQSQETYDLNSTSEALPEAWARYQVYGQLALSRDNDTLSFISTDNVVRDMLKIVEASGQDKLQFWGFSYGTVLGATFATIFPDRVGRVIIDGCLDMDSYFRNDLGNQIVDSDKAMQTFFDGCHAAGPEACPFYASSPSEIAANLEKIYGSLRQQPLPVFAGDSYGVVTYDALRKVVTSALGGPVGLFVPLAAGLAQLSAGNGTLIHQLYSTLVADDISISEAMIAIECSDADPLNMTASNLRDYMAGINSTFSGTVSVQIMTQCAGWKVHPETRFVGPVGANTSFPLLIIGNTADPITPLDAAKKNSAAFPGSVVLTQDAPGAGRFLFFVVENDANQEQQHTSLSATSNCTHSVVAAYFANGTLPEEGTICPVESELFPSSNATESSPMTTRSLNHIVDI
ncbi:alpha beta hydrolase fold family [Moniliophthora roreri]|nr:alpha beta hydrolase fold family [Moniliophthora roreri]